MGYRVGQGFDSHPLVDGRRLVLGGVQIAYPKGLQGHSDGDVVAHALANAILGALGEGDLGRHFPDHDPRYAGADSIGLLNEVWNSATGKGWRLINADLTIFAQAPKLAAFLEPMRLRLAGALGADQSRVNVKATNPEGLGTLGRGEGMAAAAIVMVEKN